MRAVRRLLALTLAAALAVAITAIVGFAAYWGFVHRPNAGDRTEQVFYAATLLIPPALFLLLALVLLLKKADGTNVLALIGIAVLVGAPTLVFFLGSRVGISLAAVALGLLGATSAVLMRRSAAGWLHGRV
jgi:Na+/melibiose symporter-like transporter